MEDAKIFDKYKRYVSAKEKLTTAHKIIDNGLQLSGIDFDSLESTTNYLEKEISLRVNLGENPEDLNQLNQTWEDIKESLRSFEAAVEVIRIKPYSIKRDAFLTNEVYYMMLFFTNNTKSNPEILDNSGAKFSINCCWNSLLSECDKSE